MEIILRYLAAFSLLFICAVALFQAQEAIAGQVKTKCQYCGSSSYGAGCPRAYEDNVKKGNGSSVTKFHKHSSEGGTLCVWCGYELKSIPKASRCPKSPNEAHRNY